MSADLNRLAVITPPTETVDRVIRRMAEESRNVSHAGLAVVLDDNNLVLGILTDGDIRRAYARGVSWNVPVSEIMVKQPITLPIGIQPDQIILELSRRVEQASHLNAKTIRHILLTDTFNRLVDIQDFVEILWDREERSARVHVIGLGFVGLTVAVSLANVGHRVTGVDINAELLEQLQKGESHIFESGLSGSLGNALEREALDFKSNLEDSLSSIYIVAVGSPVMGGKQADLSCLRHAGQQLNRVLKPGDQVMLRSTVPVGTTREVFLPILENGSGLRVAEDFNLVFAPERTLAGKALVELRTLPQLVGGITPRCTERATRFWTSLTHTVVQLPTAEAAELAKLANNSFRNVSFAFANEVAALCHEHNLDGNEIIQAANNGYPRNPIPLASPGVGGYCLPKDSVLLAASFKEISNTPRLSLISRYVNDAAGKYPLGVIENFCRNTEKQLKSTTVLVVGIAFKGEPETNDVRGSSGLEIAKILTKKGATVLAWDAVLSASEISTAGLQPIQSLEQALGRADVILLMNNHRDNGNIDISKLGIKGRQQLIFDGWNLLNRREIESRKGVHYSSLGYTTPLG